MGQSAQSTALKCPDGSGRAGRLEGVGNVLSEWGAAVFFRHISERASGFMELDRERAHRGQFRLAKQVSREVNKVRGLLDDGSASGADVPPCVLADLALRAIVSPHKHLASTVRLFEDATNGVDGGGVAKHVAH